MLFNSTFKIKQVLIKQIWHRSGVWNSLYCLSH